MSSMGQEDYDRDNRIFMRGRASALDDRGLRDTIQTLTAIAYSNSYKNEFWEQFPDRFKDERTWIGEKVALAHTELSEAVDHSRKLFDDNHRWYSILAELGDTIWRCLDMAYVIHQFDGYTLDQLGDIMIEQKNRMPQRGALHGKRW